MSIIVTQPKAQNSAQNGKWNVPIPVICFAVLWFGAAAGELFICAWLQ
jgi:hypothetical protein